MISVPSGHVLVTVQSELPSPFLASASPSAASSSTAASSQQRLVDIEYGSSAVLSVVRHVGRLQSSSRDRQRNVVIATTHKVNVECNAR